MIPRYTRPEMGRIWSDENRFRTWLAVEVAATETLAAAGIVPKDAAKAIRERADFNVDRIFQIEAEVKHDVIAFTTAVAEIVGPACALVSLRPHVERRRRHRASAAHSAGIVADRRRPRAPRRRARTPRLGIQGHAADRTHPRRPRRADHLRIQDRQLVFGNAAQHRPLQRRRGRPARWKVLRRGRNICPSHARIRREDVRTPGIESRGRLVAGDPARPPRATTWPRWP